jgi:hypothetical protein
LKQGEFILLIKYLKLKWKTEIFGKDLIFLRLFIV